MDSTIYNTFSPTSKPTKKLVFWSTPLTHFDHVPDHCIARYCNSIFIYIRLNIPPSFRFQYWRGGELEYWWLLLFIPRFLVYPPYSFWSCSGPLYCAILQQYLHIYPIEYPSKFQVPILTRRWVGILMTFAVIITFLGLPPSPLLFWTIFLQDIATEGGNISMGVRWQQGWMARRWWYTTTAL